MADYKYTNQTNTAIQKYSGGDIVVGGNGWAEYLDYVAGGGQTDPWKTDEELLEMARSDKLQNLRTERDSRVDTAVGTDDPRRKDKIISRSVKLLRRELKETITPEETTELDTMEALDDFLDTLDAEHETAQAWLEDTGRTIEQIEGYNVATDPGWSVSA